MSFAKYKAYCEEFDAPCRINKHDMRTLKSLSGNQNSIGTVNIPVKF